LEWSLPDYVTIHVYQILPPEAVINVDVTVGPSPLTVQFDASGSFVDPYAGTLTYDWNFGDGSYSLEVAPTHTYEYGPYTYTAVLTIFDSLGQHDSDVIEITVEEPVPAWGEASVVGMESASPAKGLNHLIALLVPIGAVLFWKGLRKRK
ncbi:MAG: PKD domain-containing protein, partial [bacterium]